ncbi:MAG: UDP-N-acetylmuramoyl-tripeptide--D-alanyl-D-alanine ligase [Candidatus Paceibacterota bacterium]|jgi:UDP-N-acetylmuramoyl-tripeptide--D-alanyl-D-alanine ligase
MLRKTLKHILRVSCKLAILRYKPFIIAITGNTGKTSTKEAVFLILKEKFFSVGKTRENFNTDIGVPLSILGLSDAKRNILGWARNFILILKTITFGEKSFPKYLVLELAADKPGEIEYFVRFLPINIGIVTAIGENPVHLQFFPSKESLINEKSWLVRGVKDGGVILNYDDKDVLEMKSFIKKGVEISTYGKNDNAQVRFKIDDFFYNQETGSYITNVEFKYEKFTKRASFNNLLGDGYIYAVCAAVCFGLKIGNSLDKSIRILQEKFHSLPGRMSVISSRKKFTIIDDTYNASPLSYVNALNAVEVINVNNRKSKKILVLGDMSELGKETNDIHSKILKKAIGIGDKLILIGDSMHLASKKNRNKTKKNLKQEIYLEKNSTNAFERLLKIASKDDIVLVKGSHRMDMSKVVELSRSM